jgi:hypothetical protein
MASASLPRLRLRITASRAPASVARRGASDGSTVGAVIVSPESVVLPPAQEMRLGERAGAVEVGRPGAPGGALGEHRAQRVHGEALAHEDERRERVERARPGPARSRGHPFCLWS